MPAINRLTIDRWLPQNEHVHSTAVPACTDPRYRTQPTSRPADGLTRDGSLIGITPGAH